MSKYRNWELTDKKELKKLFEQSIAQHGRVTIVGVLDHVSASGMSRHISLFMPLINDKGAAVNTCIARERYAGGCGMDMGFNMAYGMFMDVYSDDSMHPYQKYLNFSWL